ncbi:MAG: hypothetical protein M3P87_11580, partial [Actinomycetota bacterium]|nr:hypothetical protein [Actinomycetota bacterium]
SSALRYADLVPWEVLRRARSRGAPVIHVLNRVTSASTGALADYRRRLEEEWADGEVLVVHEHHLAGSMSVPSVAARSLRRRLMSQVEDSQQQRAEIVRSVLWAILGQARDLIAAAELGSTEADLMTGMLGQAFVPAPSRIVTVVAGPVEAGVDISLLARHGRDHPRRAQRWMRRKAPGPEPVAASRHRLLETVVIAVATDLRVSIHDGDLVLHDHGLGVSRLDPATHHAISGAAESWWAALEEICAPAAGNRADFAALLLAVSTLRPDPMLDAALEAILPGVAPQALVGSAVDALARALIPVYGSVRDRLVSMVTDDVTPTPEVDRARTLVAEVVARSAFANA